MSNRESDLAALEQLTAELMTLRETYLAELAEVEARMPTLRALAEQSLRAITSAREIADRLRRDSDPADFWKQ